MTRWRAALALLPLLLLSRPALAVDPPYEAEMEHLAELMGSLYFLSPLCLDGSDDWRAQMADLVTLDKPDDDRRQRLYGAFNTGYAAYSRLYRQCTPSAREAVTRLLTDAQATRQGILNALTAARTATKPTERFVFYFAGHGTNSPVNCLLPSDARKDATTGDLTRNDLYDAVRAIPARSRTIILDSCFSGGMSKSIGKIGHKNLRPRYAARLT